MPFYNAYGLLIDSELPLYEVPLVPAGSAALSLKLGTVDFDPPEADWVICRPLSETETILYFKPVGTAFVRGSREITLQPALGADPLALRLFVLQQILGVILLQRDYLVLHSAGAIVEGGAVAFMGTSGQGKSTLAGAMNGLDCPVLSDDVLAIDMRVLASPMALPGLLQLKLTEESRVQIGSEIVEEQVIRDRITKKLCSIRGPRPQNPVPLRAAFVLETGDEVSIARVDPMRAVIELIRHTYGAELLPHIGRAKLHFQQCAALAERVPVFVLRRPRDLLQLNAAAYQVIEQVKRSI